MADVVLLNPWDHTHIRKALGLKAPPLNLLYLAAALREHGYSVQVIDDNIREAGPEGVPHLIQGHPLFVGVTAATSTLRTAAEYLRAIRAWDEGVPTVVGGPHVSFLPTQTLSGHPEMDVAVIGEGEVTICELADELDRTDGDLDRVRGLAYRDDGHVRMSGPRGLIEDIDELPIPARDLVDLRDYRDPVRKEPIGTLITSRGCAFSCTYCASSRLMGRRFRARKPSLIVDEMEGLMSDGIKDIEFIDDNFLLNKRRAIEVGREVRRRGLDVGFSASSRVDTQDREALDELRRAGMHSIYLGIESGSQRVLDLMGKGTTVGQAIDAVHGAKGMGINVLGSFILGYPGETLAEMRETIKLSLRLPIDYAQFSVLTPYPGTPVHEQMTSAGLLAGTDYDHYTAMEPVIDYRPLGVESTAVSRMLATAYLRFYLRPSYLMKHHHMLAVVLRAILNEYGGRARGTPRP